MVKTQHQQLSFLSTYTSGQESESEAHTAEGGHIHSLTTDNTSSTNTGGVFTRSGVGNGLHQNLDGVLLGHQVDDIESLLHNLHSVHLLTSVAAVEHQAVSQTLNERALSITTQTTQTNLTLAETLQLVSSSSVGKISSVLGSDSQMILKL